jgi:ABC-type nitrate/sulfonate/bicarbonate transport system substrate-binding protein
MMAPILLGIPAGTGKLYAGPTLVALGRGYFSDQGLDVQVIESGGRRESIPLLAAGELDVSPQGPSLDFFRAWDPARPIVMAADHGSARPGRGSGAVVARPSLIDSGALRDFVDLRGKRIGLSPVRGDHDWLTFGAALERGGLTFDDVEVVVVDFGPARHQALVDGTIDLATVGRLQSIADAKAAGAFVVWKHDHEIRPGRQQRTVMFGHRFWTTRGEDAARYLVGYLRGARDYSAAFEQNVDREAVLQTLAEQSGYPLDTVREEMVPDFIDPDGRLNVAAIAQELSWFEQQGLLPQPIPLDQVVNQSFLDTALEQVGPYASGSTMG